MWMGAPPGLPPCICKGPFCNAFPDGVCRITLGRCIACIVASYAIIGYGSRMHNFASSRMHRYASHDLRDVAGDGEAEQEAAVGTCRAR